jgi:Zn-dependent peptidase ImmA (M78 family)
MLTKDRMEAIEAKADQARQRLTVYDLFPVPMKTVVQRIADVCSQRKVRIKIEDTSMFLDQAYTYFKSGIATIVLSRAVSDEIGIASRADFTLAHELGHALLHDGKRAFSRSKSGKDYRAMMGMKGTQVLEQEANYFAAAFLIPRSAISDTTTAEEIMSRFRVSRTTAEKRLAAVRC